METGHSLFFSGALRRDVASGNAPAADQKTETNPAQSRYVRGVWRGQRGTPRVAFRCRRGSDARLVLVLDLVGPLPEFVSRLVEEALVVGVDLPSGEVQRKLQGDQDAKLEVQQLFAVEPKTALELLDERLHLVALDIVQLG